MNGKRVIYLSLLTVCLHAAQVSQAQSWQVLNNQADTLYESGSLDSAFSFGTKALAAAETEFGKTDSNYASSLDLLALISESKGNYADAESLFKQAMQIRLQVLGPEHPDYAATVNYLGDLYDNMGQYSKAEPLYAESMAIRKKVLGELDPAYAISVNNMAGIETELGNYDQAEPLFKEVLNIYKLAGTTETAGYAIALTNFAELYKYKDNVERAGQLFMESLSVCQKAVGPEDPTYAALLCNAGDFFTAVRNYTRAEEVLREAKAIYIKVGQQGTTDYAYCLSLEARLNVDMGNYAIAEQTLLETLALREKIVSKESPDYATSLNNLAEFYEDLGNYDKADPLFIQSLAIDKKVFGEKHPTYALQLNNLAELYQNMGWYDKAEPLLRQALTIHEAVSGKQSQKYASALSNLAGLYFKMYAFGKADTLFGETLTIYKQISKSDNSMSIKTLNSLADLYFYMGRYRESAELFKEAKQGYKKVYGSNNLEYAEVLNNLGSVYEATGDYEEAKKLYILGRQILMHVIAEDFGFLSEVEKSQFLATVFFNFEIYQGFFRNYAKADPTVAAEAYNIELSTKGLILSSDIQLRRAITNSGDTNAIRLFHHWIGLKSELAKLYTQPDAQIKLKADSISSLANSDEKKLTRLSASFREGRQLTVADWKGVRNALKPHEAAVEFSSYTYHNKKRRTDTVFYTALVLREGDPYPVMVRLCRQDQLNTVVSHNGETRSSFINELYRGVHVAEKDDFGGKRQQLYRLIWKPIEKYLHPGDHIYYSPSGLLYQVAFAAMRREDGTLLSDHYRLTQLSSTGMLLQPPPLISRSALSVAAFGGIDYDASLTADTLQAHRLLQHRLLPVSRSLLSDPSRDGSSFGYLPGTLDEIGSIDSLAQAYHIPAKIYRGDSATEQSYKMLSLGPSPQVIHIATHGFFFADPAASAGRGSGLSMQNRRSFQLSDDPLNRTGLIFAGGNHTWKGEAVPDGAEDGILTAYEASTVPLSQTKLVVLSACETGLGDIKGSEGVFGLQRGFKAAGADYLLMTLWQIPDKETAEFMTVFYQSLFSGKPIETSFLAAQKVMKARYRVEPYKWAAFVLMR